MPPTPRSASRRYEPTVVPGTKAIAARGLYVRDQRQEVCLPDTFAHQRLGRDCATRSASASLGAPPGRVTINDAAPITDQSNRGIVRILPASILTSALRSAKQPGDGHLHRPGAALRVGGAVGRAVVADC